MNVFVSYSSRDRREALQIRRLLEEHDCVVWLDAFDINAAANLEEQLISNISRADLFCLLLSPTSVASEWVAKEIDEAIRQRASRALGILPCCCGRVTFRPRCRISRRFASTKWRRDIGASTMKRCASSSSAACSAPR